MSTVPEANARRLRPWVERYRQLRRRLERLEAIYEDREKFSAIVATGRVLKLAYAISSAYQMIEKEFEQARSLDKWK